MIDQIVKRWTSSSRPLFKGMLIDDEVIGRIIHRTTMDTKGCWICSYAKDTSGYSQMSIGGKMQLVHRLSFLLSGEQLHEDKQLDHLCRNRSCINPAHLEQVTSRENTIRGNTIISRNISVTSCPSGHPYDEENTLMYQGRRYCRSCRSGKRKVTK